MSGSPNTLFLRLEGPLQAWGDNSKFVIRRSCEAPTKSGVLGLLCCALGVPRSAAGPTLGNLNRLAMGVRVDRPAVPWWDYHTVGAGYGILSAEGTPKKTATTKKYETLVTRREYLADASFLVALQGDPAQIEHLAFALDNPKWTLYLGRKSCPPAARIFEARAHSPGLLEALRSLPLHPRSRPESPLRHCSANLDCFLEWQPTAAQPLAPDSAEVWYDVPVAFAPPVHHPRFVLRTSVDVPVAEVQWNPPLAPQRPRADYTNSHYRRIRQQRICTDHHLCVFCKSSATTVQHVTYRHAGGHETLDELRSLCRLCHDAVTMIEYGEGMGLDRIDPVDPQWTNQIHMKRAEIIRFRSLESRRRRLGAPEED